jgi:hypothetical protein
VAVGHCWCAGWCQGQGLCCWVIWLQVLGNMKGVIAAAISIALFKNPVTAKGMLGYFVTVCGVVAYSEVRAGQQWPGVTSTHVGSLLGCMLQSWCL